MRRYVVNTNEKDSMKKKGPIVMNSNLRSLMRVGIVILLLLLSLGFLGQLGVMGSWGYSLFGMMGMILMWLIPIGLIVLIFLGFVRFVQGRSRHLYSPDQVCLRCGKSVQADWQFCPSCGTSLKSIT